MRSRGFTLLELAVAMALGAVVTGLGTMSMVALAQSTRLAGSARSVATTLRLARGRALAADGPITVRFDAGRGACETVDGNGRVLDARPLPSGVLFAALPARRRLLFDGLGRAENGTVTLGAGARRRSVVTDQRGRVRVQ